MDCLMVTGALVVGALILLAYWIWKFQETSKTFEKIGLPSPPATILVGNILQLKKMGFMNAFVEWGKKYGKIYGVFLPSPTLVVADPDILKDLMVKKFAAFSNRVPQKFLAHKPWSDALAMLRNDHWKHVRYQLSPSFSSGKLKRMLPAISRVVENLNNYLKAKAEAGEEVELKFFSGCFMMDAIAGATFGIHVDSLNNPKDPFNVNGLALFKTRAWVMFLMLQFPWLATVMVKLGLTFIPQKPTKFFIDIVERSLKERRQDQTSHSDFLQLLVDLEKENEVRGQVDAEIDHTDHLTTSSQWTRKGLTDDEIKSNGMSFFMAGFENTAVALSLTLFYLAANPEALKKAQQEVDQKLRKGTVRYETSTDLTYLDMCMNETLRLHPPGFLVDREAGEDTELGGYPVKKGTRIIIPAYTLHMDPDYWPEPEKFLPERHTPEAKAARHPFAFLPFGQGPRNCIGMRLAQMEIRVALASILHHFTPVLCDKSVYPPVMKPPQTRMLASDGLWVKFQLRG